MMERESRRRRFLGWLAVVVLLAALGLSHNDSLSMAATPAVSVWSGGVEVSYRVVTAGANASAWATRLAEAPDGGSPGTRRLDRDWIASAGAGPLRAEIGSEGYLLLDAAGSRVRGGRFPYRWVPLALGAGPGGFALGGIDGRGRVEVATLGVEGCLAIEGGPEAGGVVARMAVVRGADGVWAFWTLEDGSLRGTVVRGGTGGVAPSWDPVRVPEGRYRPLAASLADEGLDLYLRTLADSSRGRSLVAFRRPTARGVAPDAAWLPIPVPDLTSENVAALSVAQVDGGSVLAAGLLHVLRGDVVVAHRGPGGWGPAQRVAGMPLFDRWAVNLWGAALGLALVFLGATAAPLILPTRKRAGPVRERSPGGRVPPGPREAAGGAPVDPPAYASLARRGCALLVDTVGVLLPLSVLLVGPFVDRVDLEAGFLPLELRLLTLAALIAYFTLCEKLAGQTLGKRVCGIVVRRQAGGPLSWRESFVRNVFRVVDFFGYEPLVGILAIVYSRHSQRVGDRLAGTVVVRKEGRS
ncbi:MAG: RDD family protein [Planctomycetes bacterium]|nr:RDD family protein [Planctomycetota bacterium]